MMIKLTDNDSTKTKILEGLAKNKEKYGERYCPCSLKRDESTVCPCEEFRLNTDMKECHCGLYVRE